MEIRKFRKKYDLELIPNSHSDIILGTLVWDPIIGKPSFDHGGMPNHIYNAFRDAGYLDDQGLVEATEKTKQTPIGEAHFAERIIEVDLDFATTLEEPRIGTVEASFGLQSVKKFTFGDLKSRSMTNLERVHIDDYLEELKKDKWADYDGKIRRVFMITELYYGSVKIVIDKEYKAEFEASIQNTDLELSPGLELAKSVEYTFDHKNAPFAMRIERVKHFNG
ncbi:MAG: hypothetical protein AAF363_19720 [Bacteroidota bacterium]